MNAINLRLASRGRRISADFREYITRRVQFALGRFATRIKSLTVRLQDVNGPRGGVDQYCEVRVDAGFRQPVIVRERQANMHAAVAFATDRAGKALGRQIKLTEAGWRRSVWAS